MTRTQEKLETAAADEGKAELQIRPFADETEFLKWRDRLAEIYQAAYQNLREYAYTDRDRILKYLDWLYYGDPRHFFVAWSEDGEPVGFISAHTGWHDEQLGQVGNVHEMVVDPAYRGRGVGRRLFETAVRAMEKENPRVILWVGEGNTRARAMYERHGFREIGRQGKWIKMLRESSVD
ncbi:MAG: GNAT family N-acetyltransferase [Calditrichaeota bacterium]|nr:GNAT family N-acetyltransferase [Calditrichota bacterium]